jgi:DNA repair protein RecO (recombination protein O)
MSRHSSFQAIVLKADRFGEMHKRVRMLSDDRGLVEAIAYGGYSQKGKLRGVTDFLCAGTCYLYTDPVKESSKITDFDVSEYFEGVKQHLTRFYTASLWAEVIISSYAGGERSELLHRELLRFLRELEQSSETRAELVSIQFVWRYLGFLGIRPDLESCGNCGRTVREREPIRYSQVDGAFVCAECGSEKQRALPGHAARYLLTTQRMRPDRALELSLDDTGRRSTKNVLYALLEHSLERELKTLRAGRGIL